MPKTITITISATAENPGSPTVSDDNRGVGSGPTFTTSVAEGDTVVFAVSGDSTNNIAEISNLVIKNDLFSTEPTKENNWTGIIGDTEGDITYTIVYRMKDYRLDPKIKVNK